MYVGAEKGTPSGTGDVFLCSLVFSFSSRLPCVETILLPLAAPGLFSFSDSLKKSEGYLLSEVRTGKRFGHSGRVLKTCEGRSFLREKVTGELE